MNILFTRFPLESAIKGGAELQTISLMTGLIARGHHVAFAGNCPALLALCREHNIPTTEWDIGAPPVTGWHALSFFWRKRHMEESLQKLIDGFFAEGRHLDAVVMLSLNGKLLLTDIVAKTGAKVFWIEHDRVGNWLRRNPWLPMLRRQSRKAKTIVVSELSHKIYRELGWNEEDLLVIPNGIDAARLQSLNPIPQSQPQSSMLRIGCVSRLSDEKGVDLLIEAIAPLAHVHLEIVGTGRDDTKLKAMVQASNVTDMVTFTPHEDNIVNLYRRIDVLILPSRDNDPFGMVAAEAMMLGIPVIVTDQCGIAGYLTDGHDAVIAEANSVSSLQRAIEWMEDPLHRSGIGMHGKQTAEKTFALSRMIDQYEQAFKN